eukprot:3693488-Pyramimonas_sp.AAC.1
MLHLFRVQSGRYLVQVRGDDGLPRHGARPLAWGAAWSRAPGLTLGDHEDLVTLRLVSQLGGTVVVPNLPVE